MPCRRGVWRLQVKAVCVVHCVQLLVAHRLRLPARNQPRHIPAHPTALPNLAPTCLPQARPALVAEQHLAAARRLAQLARDLQGGGEQQQQQAASVVAKRRGDARSCAAGGM